MLRKAKTKGLTAWAGIENGMEVVVPVGVAELAKQRLRSGGSAYMDEV